jgi:hypothetical protein
MSAVNSDWKLENSRNTQTRFRDNFRSQISHKSDCHASWLYKLPANKDYHYTKHIPRARTRAHTHTHRLSLSLSLSLLTDWLTDRLTDWLTSTVSEDYSGASDYSTKKTTGAASVHRNVLQRRVAIEARECRSLAFIWKPCATK